MLSSKFPLFDDEGRPWALCGISTDITERKQMEADLQRSEAALSALIESTNDAVWSVDRDYEVVAMNMVDLNGIVRRAAALMEPETRLRGISLRVEPADDVPRVCADGIQIEQVVLNLLLNGVEAMQTSPVKELWVSTAIDNGHVVVSVRDSGVGLEPSAREHVFDAFFTTKANGLGMGLAISRRIIDAHGGQLCGQPNSGGPGSTFSFSLPVAAV
jgi:signal transduction histidine kinase